MTWGLIGFVVIGLLFVALVRVVVVVWFFMAIVRAVAEVRSVSSAGDLKDRAVNAPALSTAMGQQQQPVAEDKPEV